MVIGLRPVTESHSEFLYYLLKIRPAYANISHKQMPTMEMHKQFVSSSPYKEWNIILVDGVIAGTVYITWANELGAQVLPQYQRKHVAWEALKMMIERHKPGRFLANIAILNRISRRMFRKLGFKPIQYTMERVVK